MDATDSLVTEFDAGSLLGQQRLLHGANNGGQKGGDGWSCNTALGVETVAEEFTKELVLATLVSDRGGFAGGFPSESGTRDEASKAAAWLLRVFLAVV